jgi:hypothetical protein
MDGHGMSRGLFPLPGEATPSSPQHPRLFFCTGGRARRKEERAKGWEGKAKTATDEHR